jgi:AraC family transcriptional regulator of adaptative response / DNA-3-methyladenine glycosylase II
MARCRRLLDLDADPEAVTEWLGSDPLLAPLVRKAPGRRVPRSVDEAEFALRAVIGQQVSTAAARTHTQRLVARYGTPITDAAGGLTHVFPSPEELADIDPATLAFHATRQRTIAAMVDALAAGDIELGAGSDWNVARERLLALPGVGAWTVEMIAMRALGDPDAFPATDMGVRKAAEELGIGSAAQLIERSQEWRPWRAYSTQYLWSTQDHAINDWPPKKAE